MPTTPTRARRRSRRTSSSQSSWSSRIGAAGPPGRRPHPSKERSHAGTSPSPTEDERRPSQSVGRRSHVETPVCPSPWRSAAPTRRRVGQVEAPSRSACLAVELLGASRSSPSCVLLHAGVVPKWRGAGDAPDGLSLTRGARASSVTLRPPADRWFGRNVARVRFPPPPLLRAIHTAREGPDGPGPLVGARYGRATLQRGLGRCEPRPCRL
jgi:hypothetical protein